MTFLNFGPLEVLLIALLTLLVFGPERLPVLFRQFGNTIRKLRDYYVVLAAQVRTELEPVEEEIREIRQVAAEVRQDLSEIASAIDIRAMLPSINVEEDVNANRNADGSPYEQTPTATDQPTQEMPNANPEVTITQTQITPTSNITGESDAIGSISPNGIVTTETPPVSPFDSLPSGGVSAQSVEMIPINVTQTRIPEGIALDIDNPWVTRDTPKQSKLDDDNPWTW